MLLLFGSLVVVVVGACVCIFSVVLLLFVIFCVAIFCVVFVAKESG
jgi:hypothetical protein